MLPTAYSHQSFHVGLLIRFADHDKDNWCWGVFSNVSEEEEEDGTFDLDLQLCGEVNPIDNDVQLQFPDDFYELLIDGDSF